MRSSLNFRVPFALVASVLAVAAQSASARTTGFLGLGSEMDAPHGFVEMCARDQTFCSPEIVTADRAIVTGTILRTASLTKGARSGQPLRTGNFTFVPATAATACSSDIVKASGDDCSLSNFVSPSLSFANDVWLGDATAAPPPSKRLMKKMLARINGSVNRRVIQVTDHEQFGEDEHWQRAGAGKGAEGDCEDIAIEKRIELIDAGYPADHLFFAIVFASRIGLHTVLVARTDKDDVVLDSRTGAIKSWQQVPYTWLGVQSVSDPMVWRRLSSS